MNHSFFTLNNFAPSSPSTGEFYNKPLGYATCVIPDIPKPNSWRCEEVLFTAVDTQNKQPANSPFFMCLIQVFLCIVLPLSDFWAQNVHFISTIFLPRQSSSLNVSSATPSHSQVSSNTFQISHLIVVTLLSIWRKQNTVVEKKKFLDTSCIYYGLFWPQVSNWILF